MAPSTTSTTTTSTIPLLYSLFFLWIEPFATLVGAFFAWVQPTTYLTLTHAASVPPEQLVQGLPLATLVALQQLGNLYLAFALIEASVLRTTSDLKVWRTLLICLLIADFGHLLSCYPLGLDSYYDVQQWNAIAYGNYLFVYFGASFRISFLLNLGFPPAGQKKKAKQRSVRKSAVTTTATATNNNNNDKKPARQIELPATPTPTAAQGSKTTTTTSTRRKKSKAGSSS